MPGDLQLRNRQRTRSLNLRLLRRMTLHLLKHHFRPARYELCIHLVDATEMARVNEHFLQHSGSTDVITFDYGEAPNAKPSLDRPLDLLHGEIFISLPDASRQAKEFNTTWQSELTRYVVHGLLHLQGYDDLSPAPRKEMKREEEKLLEAISQLFPLQQLHQTQRKATKKPAFKT